LRRLRRKREKPMKKQEIIEAARTIALEHGAGRGFSPTIHFSPPIRKEKHLPSRPDFKKPKTYLKVTALTIQGLTFLKHQDEETLYIFAPCGDLFIVPSAWADLIINEMQGR